MSVQNGNVYKLIDSNYKVVFEGTSREIGKHFGVTPSIITQYYRYNKLFRGMTILKIKSIVSNSSVYRITQKNDASFEFVGTLKDFAKKICVSYDTARRYKCDSKCRYNFEFVGETYESGDVDEDYIEEKKPALIPVLKHGIRVRTSSAVQWY